MSIAGLESWARAAGIPLWSPAEPDRGADFRSNYCIDFGKYLTRVPGLVLRPADRDQLIACLQHLWHGRLPWKVRGTGHSSGGQVLSDGGVILDVRGLDRVLHIDRSAREVTVEGGATWLSLVNQLAPQGLRPPVLTDNLRMTLAGTLSVGGIGDTSLSRGLQAGHVAQITLVTPDGSVHELTPDSDRFGYVLCGRGQLGIIAAVRLPLLERPSTIAARVLRWDSLAQFLHDAEQVRARHLYEFFRSTLHWPRDGQPFYVEAVAGNPCSESAWRARALTAPHGDPADALLRPDRSSPLFFGDRLAHAQADPIASWDYLCPNVELVFPLPAGLAALQATCEQVADSSLCASLSDGSALMLLPASPQLPLAPLPPGATCVALALRPRLRQVAEARAQLPLLRRLAAQALRAGARLYLASIDVCSDAREPSREPGTDAGAVDVGDVGDAYALTRDEFLQQQFGAALAEFRRHKARCDPYGLANRGIFTAP